MSIKKYVTSKYKKVLFSRHDDDGSIFYFSHADFIGLNRKEYKFKNKNGETLTGYFYYYDNPITDRLIVFDHGMGVGHRAYMREIEMLAKHGYLVYSYDHTGCTESEGENIQGFAGSLSDLDCCISTLKADDEYKNMDISVMGHSWGGFSTMNILGLHKEISHAVCMSGFISVKQMQKQVIPYIFAVMRKEVYKIECEATQDYASLDARDSLAKTSAKVLIIHSTDDKTVSYRKHFLKLKKQLSDRKNITFLSVKNKNHNPSYTEEAVNYKEKFFSELTRKKQRGELTTAKEKAEFIKSYDFYKMTEPDSKIWDIIFETLDS